MMGFSFVLHSYCYTRKVTKFKNFAHNFTRVQKVFGAAWGGGVLGGGANSVLSASLAV